MSVILSLSACGRVDIKTTEVNETILADPGKPRKPDYAKAAQTYVELGIGYLMQGQSLRAKSKLTRALELMPKDAEVLSAWAVYSEFTGEIEEAKKFHQKAIRNATQKQKASILSAQAEFLCRQGHWKEAEQFFQKALMDKQSLRMAEIYEQAGVCAASFKKTDLAESYFTKALERDQERGLAWLGLAELSLEKKAFSQTHQLLSNYQQHKGPRNAKSTWLALQAADALGQPEEVAKLGTLLKNKFSQSAEYQAYRHRFVKPLMSAKLSEIKETSNNNPPPETPRE